LRRVFLSLVEVCELQGWWPSRVEIAKRTGERVGSRTSVWRSLRAMANNGLVEMKREQARRVVWKATNEGFTVFRIPPVVPRFSRKPRPKTHKERLAVRKRTKLLSELAAFEAFERPALTGEEALGARSFREMLRRARLETSRRTPDNEPEDNGTSFAEPPAPPKLKPAPRIPPWTLHEPGENSGGLPIVD
jgi:hypothetical protein